ncbi:cupin domain-containing protein [Hyphomonas sp. WL0036]|uniref:cupin domain-containing protein n=1 Tax=Hyphomonas sediminis TaxID=2866160 RepID=UPI001C8267FD|nr:cupin domain-containing protein [Hyphomonas sediminis]MBY9066079.1 cupin domain-containing protein [Hyphomonas sediminis]
MAPALSGDLGAKEIIRLLNLQPHPEGGHYGETWRTAPAEGGRSPLTAIYYLLQADELSAWHRVDADEAWLWHAGGPLALTIAPGEGGGARSMMLGPDLRAGQRPQAIVPAHHWQTAETLGAWTLVSCLVAPGFEFSGFALAPPGWRPEA